MVQAWDFKCSRNTLWFPPRAWRWGFPHQPCPRKAVAVRIGEVILQQWTSPNAQWLSMTRGLFLTFSPCLRKQWRILFHVSSFRDPGWWSRHSLEHSQSGQPAQAFKCPGNIWWPIWATMAKEMACWGPSITASHFHLPTTCRAGQVSCPSGGFSSFKFSKVF